LRDAITKHYRDNVDDAVGVVVNGGSIIAGVFFMFVVILVIIWLFQYIVLGDIYGRSAELAAGVTKINIGDTRERVEKIMGPYTGRLEKEGVTIIKWAASSEYKGTRQVTVHFQLDKVVEVFVYTVGHDGIKADKEKGK